MRKMSKANQAFKNNEDAVSPVIGVILMVAITVVLAAVVFVLVSRLADDPGSQAGKINFSKDESQDRLTVVGSEGPGQWAAYSISGCSNANSGNITAGQQLTGCSGRVTVVFDETNTLVYETDFV